jgi:hypothetical protein
MLIQQPEMNNPTLVVVTDRNDLDGQLFQQFSSAKDLLKQTPVQADSRDELREMLAERQAGGIIFTTVQKFSLLEGERSHPVLCERTNVVVISDEAHRTSMAAGGVPPEREDRRSMSSAMPSTCGMRCPRPASSASPARPSGGGPGHAGGLRRLRQRL